MIKSWKHFLNSSAIYIRSGGDEWKHMLLIHSETTPFNFAASMLEHLRHWQSLSPTPMVTWWHEACPSWGPNSRKALPRVQMYGIAGTKKDCLCYISLWDTNPHFHRGHFLPTPNHHGIRWTDYQSLWTHPLPRLHHRRHPQPHKKHHSYQDWSTTRLQYQVYVLLEFIHIHSTRYVCYIYLNRCMYVVVIILIHKCT